MDMQNFSDMDQGVEKSISAHLVVLNKSEIFAILYQSKFSLSNPVRS